MLGHDRELSKRLFFETPVSPLVKTRFANGKLP
jgi:hypothetical protein